MFRSRRQRRRAPRPSRLGVPLSACAVCWRASVLAIMSCALRITPDSTPYPFRSLALRSEPTWRCKSASWLCERFRSAEAWALKNAVETDATLMLHRSSDSQQDVVHVLRRLDQARRRRVGLLELRHAHHFGVQLHALIGRAPRTGPLSRQHRRFRLPWPRHRRACPLRCRAAKRIERASWSAKPERRSPRRFSIDHPRPPAPRRRDHRRFPGCARQPAGKDLAARRPDCWDWRRLSDRR